MAYDVGNPVPGLGQAQKYGGVKRVNGTGGRGERIKPTYY